MATKKKVEETLSENKIKHLDFVQSNIFRMNSKSFQMKSWMLVIVTALLGSFANTQNHNFILLALLPTLIFEGWMHIICNWSVSSVASLTMWQDSPKSEKKPSCLPCRLLYTMEENTLFGICFYLYPYCQSIY